jgi:ubiquitin conjugation factor E4 B
MDRIDPLYYARSSRISLKDETRIKATSEEASEWEEKQKDPSGSLSHDASMNKVMNEVSKAPPPNFISDIFYLNIAMSHFGYLRTIQTYTDLQKHIEDIQRHLDYLNGDGSWMGVRLTILVHRMLVKSYLQRPLCKLAQKQLSIKSRSDYAT